MSDQVDLMSRLETRMHYQTDRQQVLTQNITNADTPGYRAMEVQQPSFKQVMSKLQPVQMAATSPMHLQGAMTSAASHSTIVNHTPSEVYPTGNTVDVEGETLKAAKNVMDYQLTTTIYADENNMMKMAAGKAN